MERKNAELQYYFEKSDSDCKRYRRERDEARKYIHNFDRLENVQNLERQVNGMRQQLKKMLTEKEAELRIARGNVQELQEVVKKKDRIIQNLDEKIKQQDLKVQHLESRLNTENSRTRRESASRKAMHENDHYISDLRKKLQETLVKLRETQVELDETKSR